MSQKKPGRSASPPAREPALEAYRIRMSDPPVVRVQHKTEWQQRRTVVREKLQQALGLQPMPDRLPLDIKSGGVLEREGYRAERLYWPTWPGTYAGGWLYTPAAAEGRRPAILMAHGISDHGGGSPEVHRTLASLALQGYVGLSVDVNLSCTPNFDVTTMTSGVYDSLRGLDLLAVRPEVDRQRIGLVAHTTGIEAAMYLLALDERIHASALAVPAGFITRGQHDSGKGASLFPVPGLLGFTTIPELFAVASPRAMLFLTPEGEADQRFRNHDLRELRAYYHLWQQPDRLGYLPLSNPEIDSPEALGAVLTWFERELRGQRPSAPLTAPEAQLEPFRTYQDLHQPPPGYHDVDALFRWYDKRVVAQPPQIEGKPARRSYQERVSTDLAALLGLPTHNCPLDATSGHPSASISQPSGPARPEHLTTRTPDHLNTPHTVSFRSEPDVRVPALWLPGPGAPAFPVLIALHPEGKESALKSPMVRVFHEAGYGILAPDVRLRGELKADWRLDEILWGRPEAGMAVTDIHACVRWLLGEEGVDARSLVLWGDGDLGVTALLAAGLDERITATVADCRSTTYRDGGEGLPLIPGILRIADVPQISSLVAPRPLWLYQVPEGRVGFSSRRYYDWTQRSFQSLGELEALKMSTKALPDANALLDWLKVRLKRAKR